ncbi:MAG: hypothetical protein HYV28_06980, partial [Ignavibacteriales bacterium]|nr:hypothetical protein [Ignavibacteriales bacterium]
MYNFYFSSDTPDINKTVCVDGFFPCALHLSHWPGNSTPAALKADTSTEIIFNLLEHPLKDKYLEGIDYVANNHYDVDGVLAAYSLMFPEAAMKMKDRLIAIARTGDFSEYHDEDSFKSSVILENLYDEKFSPFTGEFSSLNFQQKTEFVYRKAFELIPGIVENPDMYESIWQQEFLQFMEGDSSFEKRESVFSNYDDCGLSVIEYVYNLHPCVINKWSRHSTVLV